MTENINNESKETDVRRGFRTDIMSGRAGKWHEKFDEFGLFLDTMSLPECDPLTGEERRELFKEHSRESLNRLAGSVQRMVAKRAARLHRAYNYQIPIMEFVEVLQIAVAKGLNDYDPDHPKKASFSTHVTHKFRGEVSNLIDKRRSLTNEFDMDALGGEDDDDLPIDELLSANGKELRHDEDVLNIVVVSELIEFLKSTELGRPVEILIMKYLSGDEPNNVEIGRKYNISREMVRLDILQVKKILKRKYPDLINSWK